MCIINLEGRAGGGKHILIISTTLPPDPPHCPTIPTDANVIGYKVPEHETRRVSRVVWHG